jgi:hypothetical protein
MRYSTLSSVPNVPRDRARRVFFAAATLIAAACLVGCGSSAKKTSNSGPASTSHATTPHLIAIASKPTRASLAKLARVRTGSAYIVGVSNVPKLEQRLTVLDNEINTFWSSVFARSNLQWPETREAFVSTKPVQTQCNKPVAPTEPNVLCTNTFYWTLPWMEQNVPQSVPNGDVALALDVAIMWSFEVQDVLGNTEEVEKGQITKGRYGYETLCLTGLWVRTLAQRSRFQQGDPQAVEKFLASLGKASEVPQESLSLAFLKGLNSGDPATCAPGSNPGTTTTTTPTETTATPETTAPSP